MGGVGGGGGGGGEGKVGGVGGGRGGGGLGNVTAVRSTEMGHAGQGEHNAAAAGVELSSAWEMPVRCQRVQEHDGFGATIEYLRKRGF